MNAPAPVHEQCLAGHERAVVGDEVDQRPHEVLRHLGALEHARLEVEALALLRDVLLVFAGQREAGRQRVDADAVRPQLPRQRAREADHAALGRRVVDVVRDALEERGRGDVDGRALALGLHGGEHRARAQEEPAEVHGHHLVPLLDGDLHERAAFEVAVERRVVHEGVDAPEAREGLGGQPLRVGLARDIAGHGERLPAARLDLRAHGLAVEDVGGDDARARGGEAQRVGAADAAAGARDDDDAIGQTHGDLLPALGAAALRLVPARDLFARREPDALGLAHELHEVLDQLHARGAPADERVARQHEAGLLAVHGRELRAPEIEYARGVGDDVARAVDVPEERGVVHDPLHGHLGQRALGRVEVVGDVVAHERAVVEEAVALEERRRPHVDVPRGRAIARGLHAELILEDGQLLGHHPLFLGLVEHADGLVHVAVGADLVAGVADALARREVVHHRPARDVEARLELQAVEGLQNSVHAHARAEAALREIAEAALGVGLYSEAATMDPHLSGSKVARQVYHNIYEPLVTLDTRLGIKPGLAESWSQPDPKTLVFKLRRGVKFHDGTDFNAEAAKFNFDRMKTEPKSIRKGEVANIDTVEVVDAATIKVNLKKADASLLATLTDRAGMMISPKVVQERGVELGRNARGAGTGPFEFVEWVKDDHLLIKRNESYWSKQGGPYLERVRYRPIPDDTVKLQSLQGGEIDVIDYVQPRDVAAVKTDKNVMVVDVPSLADFAYQLNHVRPPFNVRALRQAVAYAIDLDQIVKGVWLNVGYPANGPIPPTSWAYDRAIPPIKRDLAKAKAKLAEGGKPGGFEFTMTTNNLPINVQEAEVIQAQLAEAGIQMKVKLVDGATLISNGNSKNFEMISYQWSGRPDPDGNVYQFYKTSPGTSLNWSGISNPQLDALLDKTREVSSQAERKKLYSEVIKILQDELPMIFIVHPIEPKAFSPRVQGYDPIPDGMMRFKDVWLR